MKKLTQKIYYPFLLAIYPAITLLAHNIEEIKVITGLRSIVISLLCATLLLCLLRSLLKDWHRAALLTSLFLIFFFSYGHIYNLAKDWGTIGAFLGRHRILFPIWLILLAVCIWTIIKKMAQPATFAPVLNLVAAVLLVFPLFQITSYEISTSLAATKQPISPSEVSQLHLPAGKTPPDIYYIILDAYSRDDTLSKFYHLDNSNFLQQLKQLDFFVGHCSQSNYAQTQLSLTSSLNFNYLDQLSSEFHTGGTDRSQLPQLLKHNALRQAMQSMGYKTYAFETGFKNTQWEDVAYYLSDRNGILDKLQIGGGLSDFELMLLRSTVGIVIEDSAKLMPGFLQADFNNPKRIHRDMILFDLDQLHQMPARPGPKLVFAHLVIPHPPFVFGPNGEFINYDIKFDPGYQNQIIFLNKQLIPLLQDLTTKSATPPIIIIQGDHGGINAPPSMRMGILNAYYLPDNGSRNLYENISPVNTFRVILNTYFGGNYPLLKDISNYSIYQLPYNYTVIPDTRPGCKVK